MRNSSILAALALSCAPAFAQSALTTPSQTAAPVMPAPREPTNPNANMQPLNNGLSEGRAVAPSGSLGQTAPRRVIGEKASGGAGKK